MASKAIGKSGYTTQADIADHILLHRAEELRESIETYDIQKKRALVDKVLQDYGWAEGDRFSRKKRIEAVVQDLWGAIGEPYGHDSVYTSEADICYYILSNKATELHHAKLVDKVMNQYRWDRGGCLTPLRRKRVENAVKKALFFEKTRSAVQIMRGKTPSSSALVQDEKETIQTAAFFRYDKRINAITDKKSALLTRVSTLSSDDM